MFALSCSKQHFHKGHFAHTHSISQPNKMICNLISRLTKSVGESLLVKKMPQEAQEYSRNQQPTQERDKGYKYPLSKNQPLELSVQTGQTGQAKTSRYALGPVPQTGKTGQGQRTANHFQNAPLGPSSQDLIIQEVLSYFSEVFSQDPHFGDL